MMEFKCTHKDFNGNISTEIDYKVHDDAALSDLMQEFRRFLLAVGFHPDSIADYISEE